MTNAMSHAVAAQLRQAGPTLTAQGGRAKKDKAPSWVAGPGWLADANAGAQRNDGSYYVDDVFAP